MKKMNILKGILLAFLAFQFLSCENEPLKGDFPNDNDNGAEEGQFKARIAGEEFIATSVSATLSSQETLTLKGANSSGKSITLVVKTLVESNYDFGNVSTGAAWAIYENTADVGFPYSTSQELNATGNLRFSEIDRETKKISGTFSFKGTRIKVDEDGAPVTDESGTPVMENIEITNGSFNAIDYTIGGNNGDDGDDDGDDDDDDDDDNDETPEDAFFAKVNGTDFIADSITVTEPMIGNVKMIKIEARTASHELIRIDIPRALGVGTFDMVSMSDGTKLIGLYKTNGGENLTSNPGSITITEFDMVEGVLAATFSFTGKDPLNQDPTVVQVRQGEMTVHFEGIPGGNNVMWCRVDGDDYAPETVDVDNEVVNQYPRIILTSSFGDQEISLSFPKTITEGSYIMSSEVDAGNEIFATFRPVVGTSIMYVSDDRGNFDVTNYDIENGIIEGTFNFIAIDPSGQDPTEYQITAGEFSALLR